MKYYLATKLKLYPEPSQEKFFRQTIGCCRFIYNYYLDAKNTEYSRYLKWQKRFPDRNKKEFKWRPLKIESQLKLEFPWLSAPNSQTIQQSRKDLETAFKRFFEGASNKPRFHKKGRKESFRVPQGISMEGDCIQLGSKNGWVKARGPFDQIQGKIKSATVSLDAGQWYVSILQEVKDKDYYQPQDFKHPICGIDLGVVKPLTVAYEDKFTVGGLKAKSHLEKLELRRKRYQRQLARKQKVSNNRTKARSKVARAFQRERFYRKNWIEQTSHKLTSIFETIVFEDLRIKSMTGKGKGKHGLNREMLRLGLGSLISRCQQKADRRGNEIVFVDPRNTSRTCSDCGVVDKRSRESQSRFHCVHCGFKLNADKNAALNVLARGLH